MKTIGFVLVLLFAVSHFAHAQQTPTREGTATKGGAQVAQVKPTPPPPAVTPPPPLPPVPPAIMIGFGAAVAGVAAAGTGGTAATTHH